MPTKGDRTRQRILDVVENLLHERAFEDITIAEITRRAGVTRPGFYFYFGTKGAAVASLMENLFPEFMDAASVWYEHEAEDQRTGLRLGMAATVALWRKHAVVMHGMVQAAAVDVRAREIWQQWVNAFVARAVPTISADRPPRRGSASPTSEQLATFLVDATFSSMERDVRSLVTTGATVDGTLEALVHVWEGALYVRPGQS